MSTKHAKVLRAALDRMKRAASRGTGCHLTAEMMRSLKLTFLAEIWSDETMARGKDPQ